MADKNNSDKGRLPDYNVWAITDVMPGKTHEGKIGVAWVNNDGSLSITLNSFVTISAVTNPTIKLFPAKSKEEPTPY